MESYRTSAAPRSCAISLSIHLLNRAVDGTSARFGSNMVLGFDQQSTTIDVQIGMVSKVGAKPQSAPVVVKTSPGPNVDGICFSSGRGPAGGVTTPVPAPSHAGHD
jgi:hypothetical protein